MNHQNLLDQAKIFALKVDYISVSTLQRKLLIGYNQATKILEILIREGICESKLTANQGYLVLKKEEL